MLLLRGPRVYTPFRQQQVFLRLKKKRKEVCSIKATYYYFVDYERPLSKNERERLENLLPKAFFSIIRKLLKIFQFG